MLTEKQRERLTEFCHALIDQETARVIVKPNKSHSGYWVGSGNMVEDADGAFYLSARYRDFGDSRTGLSSGARGVELAIFKSTDRGGSFEKILAFSKEDLSPSGRAVLSIEGSALRLGEQGVELFTSSEKDGVGYPPGLEQYLKPGAGVWTIERIAAPTIEALADAPVETYLTTDDPQYIHIKDPFLYETTSGKRIFGFCTHPFTWASTNCGYAICDTESGKVGAPNFTYFPRGAAWDVAISRVTGMLRVPAVGEFAQTEPLALLFYDGGESLRNLDEHKQAVSRPRGYSCEELGGAAVAPERDLSAVERLSDITPMFVSPYGTGASRYVDVLECDEGYYAAWEQSQPDRSQPLVMNFVSHARAKKILE